MLEVRDLKKHFPIRKGLLQRAGGTVFAVDGVSFTIAAGRTLGLVGEIRLRQIDGRAHGAAADRHRPRRQHPHRRQRHHEFGQGGIAALPPANADHLPGSVFLARSAHVGGDIVAEPLRVHGVAHGAAVKEKVAALFERVGLRRALMNNYPHSSPAARRQRIGIARARLHCSRN